MSDTQAAYQQALAEKIAEIVVCNPDKEFSDRISAVLAAKGVVDPEEVNEKWSDAYATAENRITNLEQQLAALRKNKAGDEAALDDMALNMKGIRKTCADLRAELQTTDETTRVFQKDVARMSAEVERLKAAIKWQDGAVNEGMEQAAVIVLSCPVDIEDDERDLSTVMRDLREYLAAAIRAEIKSR